MSARTVAGRYELIEPLGSGWRARDAELEREVVVRLGADAEVGAAGLAHPHIERVFDQGEADGERYVVLEYLPGGSLAERGALTEDDAGHLAVALAYAHANGVVHGAITPEAVQFDSEGRAKLAGFTGAGEPEEDIRALGALLEPFAGASRALAAAAAAALAGDLAGAQVALADSAPTRVPAADVEPATQIIRPSPAPGPRRPSALIALVAAAAVAGGLAAAFLATSGDSDAEEPTTGSLSVPVPTGTTESTTEETDAPPPATTAETTTEATTEKKTTTATTAPEPEPAPPPTTPPPGTTIAPPPTTEPEPLPTTEPPPATTTEQPPPTTTETTPVTTAPA